MSVKPAQIRELESRLSSAMLADRFHLRRGLKRIKSRKDPDRQSKDLEKLRHRLDKSIELAKRRQLEAPQPEFPSELPVNQKREEISALIRDHQVVIVCGETGSGKSTQLPKICLAAGRGIFGKIGHTQPRRIAARSVAARISEELKSNLGQSVGYKVRFTDQTDPTTFIKLMTDGILLSETQGDRFLEEYDTLIIDEAHERSLNIDFLLGYLKSILHRRPDLKLIITSATIDAKKFSQHFSTSDNVAPIIEVSGRNFPVDIVYRPLEDESGNAGDLFDGICRAVEELNRDPGDMLIFLPTEKDIRGAAKRLRALDCIRYSSVSTEILPLYARLSVGDQNRIFRPGKARRIVLATNVAESSLTVPRIRYVIDSGTARISRYSARSKIQRLPIEPISQASANQRAGRCGRIGPGVCIRLYSEEDFSGRDEFTTPEIRRTNLASVILQAKAMHFGDVDRIDFIDPPRTEAVRDGYRTLFEIGATDGHRDLTELGHQIKRFPTDPRIARMLLAADHEGVLADVLIIASALEVQDVRERPAEKQQQADEAHRKFKNTESDFLSLLSIWDFYHQQKEKLSNNQLKRALLQNFLSYNRIREWLDVYRQLRETCTQQKLKPGARKNDYDSIHRSLLAGLLSGIATKGEQHSYAGAGGVTFHLWPGSGLMEKSPKWILGSELVETSRRFLRNVARIQPAWIEPLGAHLTTRSYSEPHWHQKSEQVMAHEKVSLFGLVIVPRRKVPYGKIDPDQCRTLFLEEGLVQNQMNRSFRFLDQNAKVIEEIESLAAKTRRRDLVWESAVLFQFYDHRLPDDIIDGTSLHRWLKESPDHESKLMITEEDLLGQETGVAGEQFPESLDGNSLKLDLRYAFEPGSARDGVTTTVPQVALNQLNSRRLEWLVPGMVEEKIVGLIRTLPKSKRRALVPAPDKARELAPQLEFAQGDFLEAVARGLSRAAEEPIQVDDFDLTRLDSHLQINIEVTNDEGEIIDRGRDLRALQEKHGGDVAIELPDAHSHDWSGEGFRRWDFPPMPKQVHVNHGGIDIVAYPAILDSRDSVTLRVLPTESRADQESRWGLMRLAVLRERKKLKAQFRWMPDLEQHRIIASQLAGGTGQFDSDLIDLLAKRAFVDEQKSLPRDAAQFENLFGNAVERISVATQEIASLLPKFSENYQALRLKMQDCKGEFFGEAVGAIRRQLKRLLDEHFWTKTPWIWLQRYPIYFQSAMVRLEKLNRATSADHISIQRTLDEHVDRYEEALKRHSAQGHFCPELDKYRWMIEELSVSLFSQQLGTLVSVSEKRLEKQLSKVS